MEGEALNAEVIDPRLQRLSPQEAEELLRRVADLARLKTDLPGGLRASAEGASPRLAAALHRVADEVERGRSPENALQLRELRLPPHLAGLITAAMSSGNVGSVLSEIADIRQQHDDAWRRTRAAIAYPLAMLLLTSVVFVLVVNLVTPPMWNMHSEWEVEPSPPLEAFHWFVQTGQWIVGGWLVAVIGMFVAMRWFGPNAMWCRARNVVPLIGKTFLWSSLIECLRLVKLLVDHGVPLPEAWRLAARGVRDGHMSQVADRVAKACEQGQPFSVAISEDQNTFPASLKPFFVLAEQNGNLSGSLQASADILEHQLLARTEFIRAIGPPVLFLVIATLVVSLPLALVLLPMLPLIQGLSSGFMMRGGGGGGVPPLVLPGSTAGLIAFFPLALAMTFSRRLIYGDRKAGRSSWLETLLWSIEMLTWTFAIIGYLMLAQSFLSLILLLVAIYVVVEVALAYRATSRETLLNLIAIGTRLGVPLVEIVRARSTERSDYLGRRSKAIARDLEKGLSLQQTLLRRGISFSQGQQVALAAALATDDFGRHLTETLERQRNSRRELGGVAARFTYLAWTVVAMMGVLTFVMLKIVPVWAKMFQEFDLELPSLTLYLVNLSNFAVSGGFVLFPLLIGTGFLIAIAFDNLAFWLTSQVAPVLHRFRKREYGAWLLHALATAVRSGQPIALALVPLAEKHPIRSVSKWIAQAAKEVEQGQAWHEALRRRGFISAYDAAFLAAAERNNHLAWALDEAATNMERRRILRLRLRANLVFPLATVMLGAVTAFVFISLFMPLIALIQGLSGAPR